MSSERMLSFFDVLAPHIVSSLGLENTHESLAGVLDEARLAFSQLLPDVPYTDNPSHTMAQSMYFCAVGLAFLKPIRARSIDLHCLGRAIYHFTKVYNESVAGSEDLSQSKQARERSNRESEESHLSNDPKEFVWDVIETTNEGVSGFNVTSCAICQLYSKHQASELVPYLCAGDDLVSDAFNQGLRRTGTIALGSHTCDFRFQQGRQGTALADRFPTKIMLK